MCTGAEAIAMGGQGLQGLSSLAYAGAQNTQGKADVAGERSAAQQQAENIMRATQRQRGAARAATAASGAAVDVFSLGVEEEIQQMGEKDAAMTILGAERRAQAERIAAKNRTAAGLFGAGESLVKIAAGSGWKGGKKPTTGDFSRMDRGQA